MVIHGIIRPPPEIRAVADRTALYVVKNGRGFETRILNSSKGQTPKFAFLHESSPFHTYYEERIQHYEQNGTDEATDQSEKKQEDPNHEEKKASSAEKTQDVDTNLNKQPPSVKASAIDPIAKALLHQRSKIAEYRKETNEKDGTQEKEEENSKTRIPPPPRFTHLELVAPKSLSLEHLEILQLTAQFVALGSHVHFLDHLTRQKWNDPYFAFCQPRHALFPYFSSLVDSYKRIKDEWIESSPVEPPLSMETALEQVAYRAEYERDQAVQLDDPSVRIDWHSFIVVETIDFAVDEVVDAPKPPPLPPPPPSMEEVLTTDNGETIRVVPTYKPKVADASTTIPDTIIDPITGKAVRAKDMPEHMRIQLLDPKWAQERKKFQDKQKETNLVSGDVVASNLERFSQQREDRFGKKEQTLLRYEVDPQKKMEDEERAKRDQAHQNAAVGPTLPGQHKNPPMQPPMDVPDAKRPRYGYGETGIPPPLVGMRPQPPESENPFAAAATGTMDTHPDNLSSPSEVVDAESFAASVGASDVTLQIRIPNDPSQLEWNYYGQIVPLTIGIRSTVKAAKTELSQKHLNQLPVNKMQLKNIATGTFLKDSATLAALNIGPGSALEMVPRARGGKKK